MASTYRTSTSDRAVIVKGFGQNAEIRFEMLESHDDTQAREISSKGKLISAVIRLLMVSVYRSRRRSATGLISALTLSPQPKILEPVIDLIVFFLHSDNLHRLLSQAISDLKPTNLDIELDFDPILESPSDIINMIYGDHDLNVGKLEVGGLAALRAMNRRLITFTISCPAVISLWLETEPLRIGPDQLCSVLTNEINQRIISLLTEMTESTKIATTRVPTGLVCQSAHKIFIQPKFKLGMGLTVQVQRLTRHHVEQPKDSQLSSQETPITDYLGQVGLKEWWENITRYLVE